MGWLEGPGLGEAEELGVEEEGVDEIELFGDLHDAVDAGVLLHEELAGLEGQVVEIDEAHGPGVEVALGDMFVGNEFDGVVARVDDDAGVELVDFVSVAFEDLKELVAGEEEHAGEAVAGVLFGGSLLEAGEGFV